MQFAVNVAPFGDYADPAALASLASDAEDAGWDGFFIWDHVVFDPTFHPIADPWVALAAIAMSTSRMRIGTMLTPLARRRPWKVARETVGVDRLSGGRLTLCVGLGDPVQWDYGLFHEETDARVRAEQLDEALDVLQGLWSGEPFAYEGRHYRVEEVRFLPRPVQRRVPIWVGGWWPNKRPFRRASRYDGVAPGNPGFSMGREDWASIKQYIKRHRSDDSPFDYVHAGATAGEMDREDHEAIAAVAGAGVTWWVECIDPWRFGHDAEAVLTSGIVRQMRDRILQGPPSAEPE